MVGMFERMSPTRWSFFLGLSVMQDPLRCVTASLQHGEEILEVNVIARQLVSQKRDDVSWQVV